jgi:quercetin 2,3-dioxygenase
MSDNAIDSATAIERVAPLAFPYTTRDPFLFCVHHDDHYPPGNAELGPLASLAGRNLGQDFVVKDGFRMYHGKVVPGFPCHPHRGFETVTIVRSGFVDHSDSMGAAGRYGAGDVQWMTAGGGIQHSEMFPLLDPHHPNRTELFQIWLNLPAKSKFVAPYFKMIWDSQVPKRDVVDDNGKTTRVTIVAGIFDGTSPAEPPPDSWASRAESDVAIWTIRMAPQATFTLPPARLGTNRSLYFFAGSGLRIGTREIPHSHLIDVRPDVPLTLHARNEVVELLLLQGRPIGEPVVQHGPFVMNSRQEIIQTLEDYQRTEFGGWPWKRRDPVHGNEQERFALHAGGRKETPA